MLTRLRFRAGRLWPWPKYRWPILVVGTLGALTAIAMLEPLASDALTVPPVTTPSTAVNGYSTPSISTPSGAPPISWPSVSTPSIPSASVPSQSVPSPSAAVQHASDAIAGAPQTRWAGSTPHTTGAGEDSLLPSSSSQPQDASSTATTAHTSDAKRGSAASDGAGIRHSFSKRYLRGLVLRFKSCLAVISTRQEKVLALRTGLGLKQSYGPSRVARILHVSVAREGQIEHNAVAALGSAAAAGFCSDTRSATTANVLVIAPEHLSANARVIAPEQLAQTHSGPPMSSVSSRARQKRRRVPHSFKPIRPAVSRASTGPPFPFAHPNSSSGVLLLIVLAGLGAAGLLALLSRRRMVRARPTAALAGATAASPAAAFAEDGDSELAAYRRADQRGDPVAAFDLGVLLASRGDRTGAVSAFHRADERGDATGASNLGVLLEEQGDAAEALAAYRRADERGDAGGSFNLGCLLAENGDLDGAAASFRRAEARGDCEASLKLGALLASRGDVGAAREAYRRAKERGDPEIAEKAGLALTELEGAPRSAPDGRRPR